MSRVKGCSFPWLLLASLLRIPGSPDIPRIERLRKLADCAASPLRYLLIDVGDDLGNRCARSAITKLRHVRSFPGLRRLLLKPWLLALEDDLMVSIWTDAPLRNSLVRYPHTR